MPHTTPAPTWLLFPLLYTPGLVLIILGLPLYRGRIPRNPTIGVRLAATLADDQIWYPINARAGRDLIVFGILHTILLTTGLAFGTSWPLLVRLIGPLGLLVLALPIEVVVLWRAAERLARQHRTATAQRL